MTEIIKKIGISEYREIIVALQQRYNYNFSDYALTSLKRRIEKVYNQYNFTDIEDFLTKLTSDEDFYETFLKEIFVPTTEMFRDPQLWIELKEKIFIKSKFKGDFKIWVPEFTTDDEIFSLLITLKETECLIQSKITATSWSKKNIEKLPLGVVDLKKMEANSANYTRQEGDFQLSKYFDIEEKRAVFDNVLLSNVTIKKYNIIDEELFANDFNLVLFRNKILYYNLQLQNKIIEKLYNSLSMGGYLIIGINESMESSPFQNKFLAVSKTENIFKKVR